MKIPPGPRQGADANWQDGWLERAIRVASPNYGPRPASTPVDLIVLHSISLPPGEYGGTFVQQLFTNQLDWDAHPYFQQIRGAEVSAHFYIQRTGQLTQFVSTQQRAWHAGKSQWCGRDNCNDFSIGIELEGLEDHPFETIQYEVLRSLIWDIQRVHPLVQDVVGHSDVAPGRKRDPGDAFNWRFFDASGSSEPF
ncbi:MAG: 1,6-anhydro-N-acetylmuramyl-L-alanine amidase AmpD [Burkholderiaceae bacterium]|nr:1,6-anhydro-N-acetylmuramyl-L-alanine amidase AmpD [Burkholderiaceae bacterium]